MLVSGANIALCLLALAVTSLPLYLGWVDGPICSWLARLRYSLNLLLCERARLHLRLELFEGKFFFSPLAGYPTVWVAISRKLPQSVLRAFRPGPYPKCSLYLPVLPTLAGGGQERLG